MRRVNLKTTLATIVTGTAAALLLSAPLRGQEAGAVRDEIETLKKKVERLEAAASDRQAGAAAQADSETPWYKKLDIEGGATGIVQGTSNGNGNGENVIDASMSFDLYLTMPVSPSGKVYARIEAGGGNGIDADVPTFSGFNGDADDDHNLRPTELWYEHALGDKVRLRGGKIDLTTDFDTNAVANCENTQFLSAGFVNNLAAEFPDDNGLGAMLWFAPSELWDLGIGFADADADWDNIFRAPFTIGELAFKPKLAGRQGNYRVYGWHNGKEHEEMNAPYATTASNYGFGLSFDQELGGGVTLFARYGRQRDTVAELAHAWSAGFQFAGQSYGREGDVLGLAYGQARVSDWRRALDGGNEHHLEIYYSIKANDHLRFSPNLQWVKNPAGDKTASDVWALGVRAQFSF